MLIQTWQTCYEDFLPASFLKNLNLENQIDRHNKYMNRKAVYYLLENDQNELHGFISYGNSRYNTNKIDKEIYTLYVRPNFQGKGLGTSLLQKVQEDCIPHKYSIGVSVFSQNPYRHFYEKNGFEESNREEIKTGNHNNKSIIYVKQFPYS